MSPVQLKAAIAQAKKFLKRDALTIIGVEAKKHFQRSFERDQQGFIDTKLERWKSLKPETVNQKSRKNGSTPPILTNEGHLRDSIDWNADYGKQSAVLSSHLPYAKIHNEGGKVTGTQSVREHSRKGKLVKAHTRTVDTFIPKRQFMGPSAKLNRTIVQKLEKEFLKIFK